jgi:RimJ/RimL family protein N-acetyltransferase
LGMFEFKPLSEEDLSFVVEVRNECRDALHDNRAFTLEECKTWFRETNPDFFVIAHDGDRIGYLRLSNHDPTESSIYVGADLDAGFRGQGLARHAYESFLPLLRERYDVSTAKLEVLSHNTTALRLYRRLGFIEVDRKKGFVVRNGALVDSIVMAKKL